MQGASDAPFILRNEGRAGGAGFPACAAANFWEGRGRSVTPPSPLLCPDFLTKLILTSSTYSDCQKFFPIGNTVVGAQLAVPLTSGTASCAPTKRKNFWQLLDIKGY